MVYNKDIINRAINIMLKLGIQSYVRKWKYKKSAKKLYDIWDSLSENEKISKLNDFVKSFHFHTFIWLDSYNSEIIKKQINKMPECSINKSILHIKLFTWLQDTPTRTEKHIRILKNAIKHDNIKKIIIDLRDHYGGSMYPTLQGLAPIFGKNRYLFTFASDIKRTCRQDVHYYIDSNYKLCTTKSISKVTKLDSILTEFDKKIQILVSKKTASSGEIIAAAFEGFSNVTIKGTSAGACTVNEGQYLAPGLQLTLTRALVRRKNMNTSEFISS